MERSEAALLQTTACEKAEKVRKKVRDEGRAEEMASYKGVSEITGNRNGIGSDGVTETLFINMRF